MAGKAVARRLYYRETPPARILASPEISIPGEPELDPRASLLTAQPGRFIISTTNTTPKIVFIICSF